MITNNSTSPAAETVQSAGLPDTSNKAGPRRLDHSFTVIVPTLVRPVLQRALTSLADGDLLPARLIIVDQGVSPIPKQWTAALTEAGVMVDLVRARPNGPADARNIGIARLASTYFAGLDEDCIPAPAWLAALRAHLLAHPEAVVTGRVSAPPNQIAPSTVEDDELCFYDRPLYEDPLKTGNFAASAMTAARIGLFDSRLDISAEDNDWGYRGLKMGVPILYAPDACVVHETSATPEDIAAIHVKYALGQGMFFGKHVIRGDWFIVGRAILTSARYTWAWVCKASSGDAASAKQPGKVLRALLRGLFVGAFRLNPRATQA